MERFDSQAESRQRSLAGRGCCGPTAAREVLQAGLWEAQDGGSNHHNPGFFPIWGAVPLPSHPTPAGVTWRYLFLSKTASHRGSWFLP